MVYADNDRRYYIVGRVKDINTQMAAGLHISPGKENKSYHRAIIEKNREEILNLASQYGVFNVRICGSVARGEDSLSSDIDLLVDIEQGRSLLSLGALLMDLQVLLGCNVDILVEKGIKGRLRQRVLKDAIPL